MPIANPQGANSIGAAVQKLSGLLAEPSEPTTSKDQSNDEQPNAQPINESSEQGTQEAKAKSDTSAQSRRRKAKLGDKEIEFDVLTDDIDLDLIPKGLMMENDYRQKTMSLSEERKAFEARKSEFDNQLAELQDLVMSKADDLESDEMKELKELDPTEYWKKFDEVKSQAEKLKAFKDKRNSELLDQQKALIEKELSRYTEVIPEWLDDSVKAEDTQKMVSFLGKNGFSEQEIGSIYDSRHMAIIRKAALYDEITSRNIESKRVKEIPKSSSPSANNQPQEKTARQSSMDRLRKTGKMSDAQAAIKNLILGG